MNERLALAKMAHSTHLHALCPNEIFFAYLAKYTCTYLYIQERERALFVR